MKLVYQHDNMDCGPACLVMMCDHYGKQITLQKMRELVFLSKEGVSLLSLNDAAVNLGFDVLSAKISLEEIRKINEPCILYWNQNHFLILKKITKSKFGKGYTYHLYDPAHGKVKVGEATFVKSWCGSDSSGIALFLEPNEEFDKNTIFNTKSKEENSVLKIFFDYFKGYKKQFSYLALCLLLGSMFTFILPFLTKELIDKGVLKKDINFVIVVTISQILLFSGSKTIEVIRNWLMLSLGNQVSIRIISDFLRKMLKLPINFFDTKMMGDFRQRIQDNERIEQFLTSQTMLTFFSIITFVVFFCILLYFNYSILLVFVVFTGLSLLWSFYYMRKRKIIDYQRFQMQSENQELFYEIFNGVTEMKLNDYEDDKRNNWENLQYKLFDISKRILKIDQLQITGYEFINQVKNILISLITAYLVIIDKITMGELLSVSFIVGQMNAPIGQLMQFFNSLQDAKLSLERINEVETIDEEERENQASKIDFDKPILINNLSFQYEGPKSPFALKDVTFAIPPGKKTAIVGASGSGKTTLLKMLLKFYLPTHGDILYGNESVHNISSKSLRNQCGVVLQEGFIFSETIEKNIILSKEKDEKQFKRATEISKVDEFISSLALQENTKIGSAGSGISGGQKQRILIARAIYKSPKLFIFDEATSSLDTKNEKLIYNALNEYLEGKTSIVIAHRLSTVKDADQIIVLDKGHLAEIGTHQELVQKRGIYFNLVQNQLELN